ncbi:uncharacterized protein KGF55_000886 [Candida pseudojiufengensis]|uniref:uncharacterized protein n=1 Tax=Candida pseudojiufengensis TaxID=497109 RepID=UPI0022255BCF|nr:uncharacterized protein KGF55_000886 [Candida pseudojiufengensis]KAI5966576.1 hypothetical protein KGF55_000886 [Candida pseudojiufengensis]
METIIKRFYQQLNSTIMSSSTPKFAGNYHCRTNYLQPFAQEQFDTKEEALAFMKKYHQSWANYESKSNDVLLFKCKQHECEAELRISESQKSRNKVIWNIEPRCLEDGMDKPHIVEPKGTLGYYSLPNEDEGLHKPVMYIKADHDPKINVYKIINKLTEQELDDLSNQRRTIYEIIERFSEQELNELNN